MTYITSQCGRNMSLCSTEVSSITGRRSALECSETISDTIDTQILVESVIQNRPKSPPPRPKSPPPIRPPDVSVTFTISEADLKKGVYATTQAGLAVCDTTKSTETKTCALGSVTSDSTQASKVKTCSLGTAVCDRMQSTEIKSCLKDTRQQSLASMYEKKIKVENTVPHKWESSMVVALTTASDKPYSQIQANTSHTEQQEVVSEDVFSQIPTAKKSTSALVSALATAPAEPFTPVNPMTSISTEPVPLPEETVPYFPPEHPIIIEAKTETQTEEKVKSSEIAGKKSSFKKKQSQSDDELFKDLPKPPPEKISMLAALTTAPERPYSPFSIDAPLYETKYAEENNPTTTETMNVKKDSRVTFSDRIQEKTAKSTSASKDTSQVTSNIQKSYSPYYSAYSTVHQTAAGQSRSVMASSKESLEKRQNVQQTRDLRSSEQSKSALVSKNVQSTEDITLISPGGMPPYIQMMRGSFETSTDKVQMEMSCQFPGPAVLKKEIIKKSSSTKDTVAEESHQKSITERKQTSQTLQELEASRSRSQRESASVAEAKQAFLHESRTSGVSESALIQKATLQAKSQAQQSSEHSQKGLVQSVVKETSIEKKPLATRPSIQTQQISECSQKEVFQSKVSKDTTMATKHLETGMTTLRVPSKERVTIIQPGQTNLSVPDISFQPVNETGPSSTTFSPRPRSLTPSMINKPAPIIPSYQASLVAVQCLAPEINVFDPTSPAISRSPSPYPGRSPSPFPSREGRAVSPAPGPPPNPLETQKTAEQLIRDSKMQEARRHVQNYIPQVQNRTGGYQAQNVRGQVQQLRAESGSTEQRVSGSTVIQRSEQQRQLMEKANLEKQSAQTVREGATQIQRNQKVVEEYEHTQKSKVIQIEKMSTDSQFRTSQTHATSGFHVTNPQPIKSSFICQGVSDKDTILQTSADKKSSVPSGVPKLSKPAPVSSGSCPSASASSTINVNKPNVSQPNAGTGGRQAGAIGVAPKRGRGILNLAAAPGSRVPLCGQCHSHIRGPFVTALGKIWCPDHFICATPQCRRALHDVGFVEERGQLYCEYCFEQYIAPPCAKCGAKVKGDCLKAIGKNFHPECFNCVYCGKLFGNNPFFLEDSQPYCEADWNEMFTTKCFACGFPVEAGDRWVEALNNNYHSQCFNCTMCKKNLEGQSFFAKGGRPFCKNHAR